MIRIGDQGIISQTYMESNWSDRDNPYNDTWTLHITVLEAPFQGRTGIRVGYLDLKGRPQETWFEPKHIIFEQPQARLI